MSAPSRTADLPAGGTAEDPTAAGTSDPGAPAVDDQQEAAALGEGAAADAPQTPEAAADRIEQFLAARAHLSLLDPDEITGVFTSTGFVRLERTDLVTLLAFVREHGAEHR
jgi:hypothetical protein